MTTNTKTTLNPNLVNLHHLLNTHLSQLHPLLANTVHISIGQAKSLCTHLTDVSVIFYLKHWHILHRPSNADLQKTHERLHNQPLDTRTLKYLNLVNCDSLFLDKSDEVINRVGLLTKVSPSITKQVANIIVTLCQHHIILLTTAGNLNDEQIATWLNLQPIFLQKYGAAQFWSAIAQHGLTVPEVNTEHKSPSNFDTSEFKLPNDPWLAEFAQFIKIHDTKPLTIGKILHPNQRPFDPIPTNTGQATITPSRSATLQNNEKKHDSNLVAWLISGAVMATVLLVFAAPKLFNEKTQSTTLTATQPTKPTTITQTLGHQDIAVVRIKEDEKPKVTPPSPQFSIEPQKTDNESTANKKEPKTKHDNKTKIDNKPIKAEKTAPTKKNEVKTELTAKADKNDKSVDKVRSHKDDKDNKENKVQVDARQKTDKKSDKKLDDKVIQVKKPDNKSSDKPIQAKTDKPNTPKIEKSSQVKATATPKTEPKVNQPAVVSIKPKSERPKADKPNETPSGLYTTLYVEQSPNKTSTPIAQEPVSDPVIVRPKNKNKASADPIINQDTIGKLGNDDESSTP